MPNNQEDNTLQFPVDPTSYKIVAEIGAGVSAVVYKALCLPLNSAAVAIKSIDLDSRPVRRSPSSSDSSDQRLDEARREAKTMSLLRHPNVLTAHCSFAVGRRLWVVMPFMSAGSLASILASSFPTGLPEPAIALFLRETLNALTYLHAQGHLHRDVKAGNILVDAVTGAVKLADFGVSASIYDSPSPLTDVAGTPYWMAPEVIHSHNGYGIKADIWSFGITALELAHGRPPLSNLPVSESLVLKLTKRFRFSDYKSGDDDPRRPGKKFSRAFKEMVGLCLNQEPAKRPSAERLLKHSFFKSFGNNNKGLDFLVKSVLHGLPSVEERFRVFKTGRNNSNYNHGDDSYDDGDDGDDDDDDDDDGGELLKEKRRRISGWNFNEDVFELDPVFPTESEDDSVAKQVRFGGETIIHNNNESSPSLPSQPSESSPDDQVDEPSESSPSSPSQLAVGELVPSSSTSGIDKEKVLRDLVMIRKSLEAERKTVTEILRVLGEDEAAETREEYLERAAEALRSELEIERRRNSELEMEVEFLKMEIQRHN